MDDYFIVYIGFIAEALASSALIYIAVYFAQKENKNDVLSLSKIALGILSVAVLVGTTRIMCAILFGGEDFVELDGLGILFFIFLPIAYSYFMNNKLKAKKGFGTNKLVEKFDEIVGKNIIEENDLEFYITAKNEIKNNKKNEGLWIKCFAENDGDNSKTEAAYIKKRVTQLKADAV
jgi:hypothetical protein